MKLRGIICLVTATLLLFLVGCASQTANEPSPDLVDDSSEKTSIESSLESSTDSDEDSLPAEKEGLSKEKTYSILFIGNSYTYYNDMPTAIFNKFAEAAGYNVEVTAITKGAYTLTQFANPADEYGAKVEQALKGSKTYDFVILQEQSVRPATEDAPAFYDAVRNLSDRIRNTGATPILYSTWGRKTGNSTLDTYGWTNESMTWKLAASYQAIGDELRIAVAHVGLAFYDIYTNQNPIDLYDADQSHPSYAGSYLSAATLFAKIFEVNPATVQYTGSLSEESASLLCEAARKVVFETVSIPD